MKHLTIDTVEVALDGLTATIYCSITNETAGRVAQQVTVAQVPVDNPTFSRAVRVTDAAVICSRNTPTGFLGVAVKLAGIGKLGAALEPGLTWTPPAILSRPVNAAATVSGGANVTPAVFEFLVGSELTVSYAWYESADGVTYGSALTDTGIYSGTGTNTLTVAPVDTTKTGYYYKCVATDNATSPGSVSSAAQMTVTSV